MMPSARRDGYRTLLIGEFIGLALAFGTFGGASGMLNPYIAVLIVGGALVWHLTVRKAVVHG